ncbi:MAG TPA: hypothetical protein VGF06_00850 [Terriglobales bacterium]|jgi:hypothetical protein
MIAAVLWYVVITAGLLASIVSLYLIWFRFPERTAEDVADYLLPVDLAKIEELLDPQAEAILRRELGPTDFRRLQRKRIHNYVAIVRRMSHNAAVLVEWANREVKNRDPRAARLAAELQQAGIELRLYCLLALVKLGFWLLIRVDSWRILPSPTLDDMREAGGIRGLETYDRLRSAASFLFIEMGQPNFEEFLHKL